jgi:addiction module antitoxin, relB/dinJ family
MASINIRVNDNDKKAVEQILADIGLTLSSATNAFYKQIIMHRGIPFELKADPFFSQENLKRLEKNAEQMKTTGGQIHEVLND